MERPPPVNGLPIASRSSRFQGLPSDAAEPLWGLSTKYHCGNRSGEQLNREFEMSLRKASLAAALAVSMVGAPVMAQTQAAPVERSGAEMEDANELRGGFIIPLIAIIAIILGILAATGGDNDGPTSP